MGRSMQKSKLKLSSKSNDIPQKLLDLCDDLKNREQNNNSQNINYKHQLGQSFLDVESKPEIYGKDGEATMMQLLGMTRKKDVDRVKAFAEQYTASQVEAYNHRYDNVSWAKIRISWSHWDKLLVGYLSKKQREEWMDAAVRNGWSCSELGSQLSKEFEKGPKHGRNVTIPSAKKAYLSKISKSL